jgi:hypothetical protein
LNGRNAFFFLKKHEVEGILGKHHQHYYKSRITLNIEAPGVVNPSFDVTYFRSSSISAIISSSFWINLP